MPASDRSSTRKPDREEELDWYRMTAGEAVERLDVDPEQGLSSNAVAKRLRQFGPNRITRARNSSWIALLARQFADVMILIPIAAAIISGVAGELSDTVAILVILLLNALIGFVQEFRAERALEALRAIATPAYGVTARPGSSLQRIWSPATSASSTQAPWCRRTCGLSMPPSSPSTRPR